MFSIVFFQVDTFDIKRYIYPVLHYRQPKQIRHSRMDVVILILIEVRIFCFQNTESILTPRTRQVIYFLIVDIILQLLICKWSPMIRFYSFGFYIPSVKRFGTI